VSAPSSPNDKLIAAAQSGDIAGMEAALAAGASKLGEALAGASSQSRVIAVRYLIDRGADLHVRDDLPLRWAARKGSFPIVRALLDAGANPNARDGEALAAAAGSGHLKIVELLLDRGAEASALEHGVLPMAATEGHVEVVRFLIKRGVRVDASEFPTLRRAAERAAYNGWLEMLQILRDMGVRVSGIDRDKIRTSKKMNSTEIMKIVEEADNTDSNKFN
jgi:ankyrin repeat protein